MLRSRRVQLTSPFRKRMVFTGHQRFTGAAIVVAALVSSACLPSLPVPNQTSSSTSPSTTASTNTGSIRIGKAVRGDLTGVVTFAAPLQTKGQIAVVPRVMATLNKVNVDVGSRVRPGDTLAELDHADLDERVLSAQAAQASAEARLAQ